MAKIIVTSRAEPSAALLGKLRRVTSASLSELRTALSEGGVLLERQVFGNDHDEAALQILGVVDCLEELGAPYDLYEIDATETFTDAPLDVSRLDLATLKNVLGRDYG